LNRHFGCRLGDGASTPKNASGVASTACGVSNATSGNEARSLPNGGRSAHSQNRGRLRLVLRSPGFVHRLRGRENQEMPSSRRLLSQSRRINSQGPEEGRQVFLDSDRAKVLRDTCCVKPRRLAEQMLYSRSLCKRLLCYVVKAFYLLTPQLISAAARYLTFDATPCPWCTKEELAGGLSSRYC
jgi:hypothetical protein